MHFPTYAAECAEHISYGRATPRPSLGWPGARGKADRPGPKWPRGEQHCQAQLLSFASLHAQ
eukprot:12400642-Alexandrium_andersonii.AAC.1